MAAPPPTPGDRGTASTVPRPTRPAAASRPPRTGATATEPPPASGFESGRRPPSAPRRDRPSASETSRWQLLFRPVRSSRPGTMPAGTALIIIAVALIAALLLSAGAIERKAAGRRPNNEGRRSIASAIGGVSAALGLTAPEEALSETVGPYIGHEARTGDQDSTELADAAKAANGADLVQQPAGGGEPGAPAGPTPEEIAARLTPKVRAATPEAPLKVWVGGDSISMEPATGLARLAGETKLLEIIRDSRPSTGLTRPDFFNWPEHLVRDVTPAEGGGVDPDVIVIMFGGNDDQGMPAWNGKPVMKPGSDDWQNEYRRRVGDTMDLLKSKDDDRWVIWPGVPVTAPGSMPHTEQMNYIYATEAAKRPWVRYLDSWAYFASPGEGYAASLPNADGTSVQLRSGDGIHLTAAGGARLAYALYAKLAGMVDLSARPLTPDPTKAPPADLRERPEVPPGDGSVLAPR